MNIREAEMVDAKALAVLFHAYRQLSVSLERQDSVSDSMTWIGERLEQRQARFLLAEENRQLLGFATLYPGFSSVSLKTYWTLNDLYVIPKARGRGVGKCLLSEVEAVAKASQAKGIELETARSNYGAQALYESIGYVADQQYLHYFKRVE